VPHHEVPGHEVPGHEVPGREVPAMRILFVAPRYHTNQVPFVRGLQEAGHEVLFDVVYEGFSEDRTALRPYVVPAAGLSTWLQRRRAPTDLAKDHAAHTFPDPFAYARRLRSLRPDVVVVRDPNRPFSAVAALAARALRIQIVLYTQGDVHAESDRRKRLQRSALVRSLDAQWFSTVPGDRSLPRVHERVHYLPFAADLQRAVKAGWFRDDRVHLLAIGKFVPRKNHLLALEAFDELRRSHPLRLTLVGEVSNPEHEAHLAEVRAFVRARALEDVVTVATNVPFGAMADLYLRHDVFVMPSHREPVGVSILEAMAHGLPVVCSTTNGARWYVEPGRSGAVFRSEDVDDLRRKLADLVTDRGRLQAFGARGRTLAETVHHPRTVAASFESIVAAGRRADSRQAAPA
jgi:glycosyltransferase involved in cell wall biosynthesis